MSWAPRTRPLQLAFGALLALALAACDGEVAAPTSTPSPTPSPSPSPSPSATLESPSPAPDPVVTEQGGTYWGVYLAVGDGPDLEDAIAYLSEQRELEVGSQFSVGDLSCDQGASETLGLDGPMRVAVYFDTQADAEAWADTLEGGPVGIAEVQTFCLD